jgi:uncharacterized iron-regulated membrane protein
MKRWIRRLHRWGAILTLIPMLLVIVTGLLLQVKKEVNWVQPATQKGSGTAPSLDFGQILTIATGVEAAQIKDWSDINRIDIQPHKGVMKIISKNHWELQLDSITGQILSSQYRRSDWIEGLHDGSFFAEWAKLYIFLPNGLILLGLWLTGVYLWWLPIGVKRRKKLQHNSGNRNLAPPGR